MEALILFLAVLLCGLAVFVFVTFERMSSRLRDVEQELRSLQRIADGDALHGSTVRSQAGSIAPARTPAPFPLPIPKTPPPPSRSREEWEALIGGKLLNRIGALELIIGDGFFLKYAVDQNWLNEITRVALGAAAGIGLLAGAHRAKGKGFEIFSQGLMGAGIAILYLSTYATFNFYHLVSQPVAFVLMTAVTIIAFGEAFLADALSVAMLGWLGGFLTPLLVSTGEANEIGLFTYLILLCLGMLAVMWKKEQWNILHLLSLGAAYFYYFAWYEQSYQDSAFGLTFMFLTAFWGIFYATDIIDVELRRTSLPWLRRGQRLLNGILFSSGLYMLLENGHHEWTGAAFLVFTLTYALTSYAVFRGHPEALWEIGQFIAGAAFLLMTASGIQFERFVIVIAWTAEAFALLYAGIRLNQRFLRYGGIFVLIAAFFRLILTNGAMRTLPPESFALVFNQRCLAFLLLGSAAWISALLIGRWENSGGRREADGLVYGGAFLFFLLLSVETADFYRKMISASEGNTHAGIENLKQLTLSGVWLLYSIMLMAGGIWKRSGVLRRVSIAVFAFTILKIFIYDLSFLETLYRIFSFLGLGVILLAVSFFYQKYKGVILGTE